MGGSKRRPILGASIAREKPEETAQALDQAEILKAYRLIRQPISLRLDPLDPSMARRIARRKGVASTQLMSMWLHEKIAQEKVAAGKDR